MKIVSVILLSILIGGYVFFRGLDRYIKYKNRKVGRKYCEENGLTFIEARNYELHTRLYFEKEGLKSWANYETDRNYNIIWKKETPIEKLEQLRKK